jgi:hypothetical protein
MGAFLEVNTRRRTVEYNAFTVQSLQWVDGSNYWSREPLQIACKAGQHPERCILVLMSEDCRVRGRKQMIVLLEAGAQTPELPWEGRPQWGSNSSVQVTLVEETAGRWCMCCGCTAGSRPPSCGDKLDRGGSSGEPRRWPQQLLLSDPPMRIPTTDRWRGRNWSNSRLRSTLILKLGKKTRTGINLGFYCLILPTTPPALYIEMQAQANDI